MVLNIIDLCLIFLLIGFVLGFCLYPVMVDRSAKRMLQKIRGKSGHA